MKIACLIGEKGVESLQSHEKTMRCSMGSFFGKAESVK